MGDFIAAIDQGTTSSRCILFDAQGEIAALAQREHRQIFPRPGWVEHDALEIFANVETAVSDALQSRGLVPSDLAAVGITNQRETTLLWERDSGRPAAHAVVWQDVRTDRLVRELGGEAGLDRFRDRTGLPLATYFSGPKIRWLLDADPELAVRAERGEILFGTMESWLIWKLTGRHVTDVTNASRTLLMNLKTLAWDEDLLEAMRIPAAMLPEIRSSSEVYGEGRGRLKGAPIAGALGDQQAALFGQACFEVGEGKCTYGTGGFLLVNVGAEPTPSTHGLITTVGYQIGEAAPVYALEGSIAVAGSLVQWLRDSLGMIASASEIESLAATVPDAGGCCFVPAFSGLFAPYWRSDARGVIAGLTGYVTRAHIARAALEATAFQVREVAEAMEKDSGSPIRILKADGGMTANTLLMQIQADLLGAEVVRPAVIETTCLGAAYAAGLAVKFWPDLGALKANWREDRSWRPQIDAAARAFSLRRWRKAVKASLDWIEEDAG